MSTKTKFNVIYCNHMFHSHSFLSLPSQPLLSYRTLQPQMNPNECVLCVYVKMWHLFHIHDRKYRFEINLCLINDYSLIAGLHIFVY